MGFARQKRLHASRKYTTPVIVALQPPPGLVVVKVGGSLYDHPALGSGLNLFLASLLHDSRVWLIPGGGVAADTVRRWDRAHNLGDEAAHWIALRSMSVTGLVLHALLPGAEGGGTREDLRGHVGGIIIIDGYEFVLDDDGRSGSLPHSWDVTSDSVAARAAVVGIASRLIMLKSTDIPPGTPWAKAAERGWVDAYFPTAVADAAFPIEAVNFRKWLDERFPAGA